MTLVNTEEWTKSSYCESNGCAAVKLEPLTSEPKGSVAVVRHDGMVYIADADHPQRPPVALTDAEWEAFRLGVIGKEFNV